MSTSKSHRLAIAALAIAAAAPVASADVITDWNEVYVQTLRDEGGKPCPISRAGAMMHAAMYDAVNSIERAHEPYLTLADAPPGASRSAAAAAAGHRVMTHLFPQHASLYDAALESSLAAVPPGPGRDAGVALGVAVADALIEKRATDGTQTEPPYVFGGKPGDYRPTWPDFTKPPYNPGWGSTVPWTMIDGKQFRPAGPAGYTEMTALLTSPEYTADFDEVKEIGALDSATRTHEQTLIAFYWANDVDGSTKPPGQLNLITRVVSEDRGLSLSENARLFALINLAMADAGLVAWDAKYETHIDLWRPITAIREADTDGNPLTIADPDWEPLNPFSPTFPSWVSGHSTFGAAHAAAMAYFFGTDDIAFEAQSEDPFYLALGGGPRRFSSFSEAAIENSVSRIYLGVHYRIDCEQGNRSGEAVGRYVASRMLLPVCRADIDGSGSLDFFDFLEFQSMFAAGDLRLDFDGDGSVDMADFMEFQAMFAAGCP